MKPGKRLILLGCLFWFLACFVIPISSVVFSFHSGGDSEEQKLYSPGISTVRLDRPGRYLLWHHLDAARIGKQQALATELPEGLHISLFDRYGKELPIQANRHYTVTTLGQMRKSFAEVEINEPQTVTMKFEGSQQLAVFTLNQFDLWQVLGKAGLIIILCLLLCAVGLYCVIRGVLVLRAVQPALAGQLTQTTKTDSFPF